MQSAAPLSLCHWKFPKPETSEGLPEDELFIYKDALR